MATEKQLNGVQSNQNKNEVRNHIVEQVIAFLKQTKQPLNLISLPADLWIFEKNLIARCEQEGIKIQGAIGIEKNKQVWDRSTENVPKKATLDRFVYDIDEKISRQKENTAVNTIWADYCGHPADAVKIEKFGHEFYRYTYPHIQCLVKFASKVTKPTLYYMTFKTDGARLLGGKQNLKMTMSNGSATMSSAISSKINSTLSLYKLKAFVSEIFRVTYFGGEKSEMVTIGFLINPKNEKVTLDRILLDWTLENENENENENETPIDMKRKAIKALADLKWNSKEIAQALDLPMPRVRAILAWHLNPNSWK